MKICIRELNRGINNICFESKSILYADKEELNFVEPLKLVGTADLGDETLQLRYKIEALLSLTCVRCLEEYDYRINTEGGMSYVWKPEDKECLVGDGAIVRISPNEKEIDVTDSVGESLILSLPMKPVCKDNCKGLCVKCGANLNIETCECSTKKFDSGWNKLYGLAVKR